MQIIRKEPILFRRPPFIVHSMIKSNKFRPTWDYDFLRLENMISKGYDGSGVTIMNIDNGLNKDVPFFKNMEIIDLVNENTVNGDHGTHVTTISNCVVVENENLFKADGIMVKALNQYGVGDLRKIEDAIYIGIDRGVDIIGGSLGSVHRDPRLEEACKAALDAGILLNFAAGNDGGMNGIDYPAAFNGVNATGSLKGKRNSNGDWEIEKSDFSDIGIELDTVFPGDQIAGYWSDGYVWVVSGTSQATPQASKIQAALLSKGKDVTIDNFIRSATDLGPAGHDFKFGYGVVHWDTFRPLPPIVTEPVVPVKEPSGCNIFKFFK